MSYPHSKSFFLRIGNLVQFFFQEVFGWDGLSQLWNELVRDGEVVIISNDGLMNSSGVMARKGE